MDTSMLAEIRPNEIEGVLDDSLCLDPKIVESKGKYRLANVHKVFTGTQLTKFVKEGNLEFVEKLLQLGADPNETYTMKAGTRGIDWKGTAAVGAVTARHSMDLKLLQILHEVKAQIHGPSVVQFRDNGDFKDTSTLLFEAAQIGKCHIVEYLWRAEQEALQKSVEDATKQESDIWVRVPHQDIADRESIPLQVAAERGHLSMVNLLIGYMKESCHENPLKFWDCLKEALERAIQYERTDVICHLFQLTEEGERERSRLRVGLGGQITIARTKEDAREASTTTDGFRDNPTVLAAIVRGLSRMSFKSMTIKSFLHFLEMPSCEEICDAVFVAQELQRFVEVKDGCMRVPSKTAYLDGVMNVAVGPPGQDFEKTVEKLKSGTETSRERYNSFHASLMQRDIRRQGIAPVHVTTYHCIIPDIHRKRRLFCMLAKRSFDDIVFQKKGCEAIITIGWRDAQLYFVSHAVVEALECILNTTYSVYLNGIANDDDQEEAAKWAQVAAPVVVWGLGLCVAWHVGRECLQHIGRKEIRPELIDSAQLLLTIIAIACICVDASNPTYMTRLVFGLNGLFRWCGLIHRLTGFKAFGNAALPVTKAFRHILGWCLCLTLYFLGTLSIYLSWGINDVKKSFWLVFNAGFFFDFDYADIEDISDRYTIEDGTISELEEETRWFWPARLFVLLITLTIGVGFINILIGVMGIGYEEGYNLRHQACLHKRSQLIRDYYLVRKGLIRLKRVCVTSHWNSIAVAPEPSENHPSEIKKPFDRQSSETSDNQPFAYLWYCAETEKERSTEEKSIAEIKDDLRNYIGKLDEIYRTTTEQLKSKGEKKKVWSCPSCKIDCQGDDNFCKKCGLSRNQAACRTWECTNCRMVLQQDDHFCSKCGMPAPSNTSPPPPLPPPPPPPGPPPPLDGISIYCP